MYQDLHIKLHRFPIIDLTIFHYICYRKIDFSKNSKFVSLVLLGQQTRPFLSAIFATVASAMSRKVGRVRPSWLPNVWIFSSPAHATPAQFIDKNLVFA
jgi:hypothetical protein